MSNKRPTSCHVQGWRNFKGHIPEAESDDVVAAYHKRLTSPDIAVRDAAVRMYQCCLTPTVFSALQLLSCLAIGLHSRDVMLLQAKAWLSWEHSVSSARTSSLQVWNGNQWQQTDFPNPGSKRLPLPLAAASQNVSSSDAPASAAASQSAGGSSSGEGEGAGDATQQSRPAPMSAFTAQALLECHYSHNHAFLQDPLLQVCKVSLVFTFCQ